MSGGKEFDWDKDISAEAKEIMKLLGNFGPTATQEYKTVKGCMRDDDGGDSTVYLRSDDLAIIASACLEVANWLNKRDLK